MNTIYAGSKPIRRLGKHQFEMLSFFLEHYGWHSVATDPKTRRVVRSLVKRGLLIQNEFEQYHFYQE